MLQPCLLQSCFHVAGDGSSPSLQLGEFPTTTTTTTITTTTTTITITTTITTTTTTTTPTTPTTTTTNNNHTIVITIVLTPLQSVPRRKRGRPLSNLVGPVTMQPSLRLGAQREGRDLIVEATHRGEVGEVSRPSGTGCTRTPTTPRSERGRQRQLGPLQLPPLLPLGRAHRQRPVKRMKHIYIYIYRERERER